ncbi:DNA recombination protein RmuC [Patescibacteria group bacterium]|nr:DNA recombination protein RmuC [Patescibacteria group bacterium]MBU0963912.1 DNA recombination protein RmuC [Patescibacteria group bacterium]
MVRLEERIGQLNEKSSEMTRVLDTKLAESNKSLQEQFGQSAKIVRDVTERLTKLDETNKQVLNFSDQLKNLQDILKNPKQRGVLGEYFLDTLLKNVLPPGSYEMQYKFKDGEIVDAVIKIGDQLIPVDSKFSLENYNRLAETRDEAEKKRLEKIFVSDLKMRIQETGKYIRPNENTMDFAFMFIPHEAIYYDLLINKVGAMTSEDTENLIQRAVSKYRVIIVSPTSFLAFLQTVLQGLRALKIEESAKEVRKNVELLAKHLSSYKIYMEKIGTHLGTTVNTYNTASKEFKKIDKDVLKIGDVGINVETIELDKPKEE